MKPEGMFPADVGNFGKRVDAAGGNRAGGGNDRDGLATTVEILGDGTAEGGEIHAEFGVDSDSTNIGSADTEQHRGLGNRHVGFGGTINNPAGVSCFVRWQFRFAGHAKPHEISCRSTSSKTPAETVAAHGLGQPAHDGAFESDGRRAGAPSGYILI